MKMRPMALGVVLLAVVGFDLAGCFERLPDASVNRGCGPVDVDSQGCPTAKFVKCALGADTNVNASSDCYDTGVLSGILGGAGGAGGASGGARVDLVRRPSPCPGECQAELPLDPIFECGRKITIARSPLSPADKAGVALSQERVMGITRLDGYKRVRITARGAGQLIAQIRTGTGNGNVDAGKIKLDSCAGRLATVGESTAAIELTDSFQSYDLQSGFGLQAVFLTTETGVAMEVACVQVFTDCAP